MRPYGRSFVYKKIYATRRRDRHDVGGLERGGHGWVSMVTGAARSVAPAFAMNSG